MIHSIMQLGESIDNTILYSADKAVQSWNWTTGRTRADLAKLLQSAGLISNTTGVMSLSVIGALALFSGQAYVLHKSQEGHKEIDDLERKASEANVVNTRVLDAKEQSHTAGYIALVYGAGLAPLPTKEGTEGVKYSLVASMGFYAAANFVMTANDLPPRKDCVRRGLDHVRKGIESLIERVRPHPTPAYLTKDQ